ncbi:conserved Plasmodium protein, unknown function [Plasmodium gallinaceum]|uniref:C2H2-type domain-containing protein n=1 Tax=Plasmodium gallinaceum TaxID=5849 RepID=A0A1J1GZU8_PLAGA|nr:conserved Plasmodium protein, unknown function [Plasmodium gallinaceum]CRG98104.1 conserved Plasmodium protein, unknown function [Plasmodium gallinaceum]
MDRILLMYIFDELCTSFNKIEYVTNKKNENNEVSYCLTLENLYENLERNKNINMDKYMKKEVFQNIYFCKDICILKNGNKNFLLDEYNNDLDLKINIEDKNFVISSPNEFNIYINSIYIYNKYNLFYYQRIKECKEKIFILLYIVSSKYNGIIQSSLSKYLNLDSKTIHYHLKELFQYLLIKKISININDVENNLDYNNNPIRLNPSYILYFNTFFIYNLLPIFIKNLLYSQNVLSINKIILCLLNKFIIIPQKILSLIFFKLLIVYNPYYFIQVRKALKIFNSILSNLINNKKIIMCKIKIHYNYENCYLNYENKHKINYDNIFNFLLLFYYNYDYIIKFINKSSYLMCEDYVKNFEFKNEFIKTNDQSHRNNLSIQLKKNTFNEKLQEKEMNLHSKTPLNIDDMIKINNYRSHMHENIDSQKSKINHIKPTDDENYVNEKNCDLLINDFKNYVDLKVDHNLHGIDNYSSSLDENQESCLSDFSFLYESDKIPQSNKEVSENFKNNEENIKSSSSSSFSTDWENDEYKYFVKNKNIYLNNLALYDKIKYLIISKGVNGITTKEISQILFLNVKKTTTFLNKLIKNKHIVKIPERKDKNFMYRFFDNKIYQYIQKNPFIDPFKINKTENNNIKNSNDEKNITFTKKDNFSNSYKSSYELTTHQNSDYNNINNKDINQILNVGKEKNVYEIFDKKDINQVQFKNLSESLNILNYTYTINKIDIDVLNYVIPKYKDSFNNYNNYKEFFDNYVENFKNFENKYDLYTCSFHFFYYLKFLLKNYNKKFYFKINCDGLNEKKLKNNVINENKESEFYIKNVEASKKDIDFIKYFMEDTKKLKSNVFIKRLFIFCHFLLCSKVTTFRFLQDLFIKIENNGKTIDRKSVQRLFIYSTKINNFFKKSSVLYSKTVKYFFYDSQVLSEKQSNELYLKFQQEYMQFCYKNNSVDKYNQAKIVYSNVSNCNLTSNSIKDDLNIFDQKQNISPNKELNSDNHTSNNYNCVSDKIFKKNNVLNDNLNIKENIITSDEKNKIYIQNIGKYNYDCDSLNVLCNEKEDMYNIYNLNNKNTHITNQPSYNSFYNSHNTNKYITPNVNDTSNSNRLNKKRKMINISCQSLNKKNKVECIQKINVNLGNFQNKPHSQIIPINSNENFKESNLNNKSEGSIILPSLENKKDLNDIKNNNNNSNIDIINNGHDYNVLYIDILNESAFKCRENNIISKRTKTNNFFQNFKTTQELSYSINYFYGYIFSKMARYKYFHKCLIRILKKKKSKIKNKLKNILKKDNNESKATCNSNNFKKRKLLKKKKKKKYNNVLSVKDILKNLYLDEYLKIISVGCKLKYIENYLLRKKKKKKMKDLPEMLFEFLTSYSLLNFNSKNVIENLIYNKKESSYFKGYNHNEEFKGTNNLNVISNENKTNEEKNLTRNYISSKKKKKEELCQDDINVIKNNDKIYIFFSLYRKLKFLYNMNLVNIKYNDINKNIKFNSKWKNNISGFPKNVDSNLSLLDFKRNNLKIYIKKKVNINLFTSKKEKKKKSKSYNMMEYNNFEEYYYNLYLNVEKFKKFLQEVCLKNYQCSKLKMKDVLKNTKFKNKSLKFLLLHNSYTNQLFLTRRLRILFINLIKKVKKDKPKMKLMKVLKSRKEYSIFRDVYNISKINIEKYFTIFYNLYNKEKSTCARITKKPLSFLCPFCNDIFLLKNDLLNHISNIHNINKKFSGLISFFSDSKHMIHKRLSDFLKIRNNLVKNSNIHEYNPIEEKKDIYKNISLDKKKSLNKINELTEKLEKNFSFHDLSELSKNFMQNEENYNILNEKEKLNNKEIQKYNSKKKITDNIKKVNDICINNISSIKNYSNDMNNFMENIKIKYSLRNVYIYFVTIIVQLIMSQKIVEKKKSVNALYRFLKDNSMMKKKKEENIVVEKKTKNKKNSAKEFLYNKKRIMKLIKIKSLNKKNPNIKSVLKKLQKKKLLLKNTIQKENHRNEEICRKKRKNYKYHKLHTLKKFGIDDFICMKLKKFQLIYYLKNRTNTIPYRKSLWNKINDMMIGKFNQNICIFIQRKLFHYFKKNVVHYFFILDNEKLSKFLVNYFTTHIYNCTYTNINYYYDKCIKNIYNFGFISLVNILKLFIINYGDLFVLYKEIIKTLFFQKIKDIKRAVVFLKKKNYVVETSYLLSNYINNDISYNNIYSNLIYKSIFYKKKLSYFSKKSFFDNVFDLIHLFGVSHSLKHLESKHDKHFEDSHNKLNIINYNINNLLYHIDNIYEKADDIYSPLNNTDINNGETKNCYKNINSNNDLYDDKEEFKNINLNEYNRNDNSCHVSNINNNSEESENLNEEYKKYEFKKNLSIFDLNYYIHNFLKGNIILYACNNYIIKDDDEKTSDHEKEDHYHEKNLEISKFSEEQKDNFTFNYLKKNEEHLKNGEKENVRKEKYMSYISSSENDSEIYDNFSDDYEIIKLLENVNENSKKIQGGISKHIKCLTKHVSEYIPNYYILNSNNKKKLTKKLSNIFSNNKEVKFSNFNNIFRSYVDSNYTNNSFFNYFKKYCIYIYENNTNGISKPFKNSYIINLDINCNFNKIFDLYIQTNNFANSIIYKKNKLLIYNINKKTFIDFDIYPQNLHLYNIGYISNIHKNIDSLLDIQTFNLKNNIFWLEKGKSNEKINKKITPEKSYEKKKMENIKKSIYEDTEKKKSVCAKILHEKKNNKNKRNYQLKKFLKKVKVNKNRGKKNIYKESFIFITHILYNVFYFDNILNNYDEDGCYKSYYSKKSKKKKGLCEKINKIYNYRKNKINNENNFKKTSQDENNKSESMKKNEDYFSEYTFQSSILNDKDHVNINNIENKSIVENTFNVDNERYDISYIDNNSNIYNKIVNKMLFIFLLVKKKKEGRFIESLKKMYLKEFMIHRCYNEYSCVKKEFDFVIFILNKLNLINIFPYINTHKIFLPYYNNNIAYKRKNIFYDHNYKYPFLNMINYHLKNFKFQYKKYTDNSTKIFKKFIEKNEMMNNLDIEQDINKTNENNSSDKHIYKKIEEEKINYNRKNMDYCDYIFMNFINNRTLNKPYFIPRLIVLFNLQCYIIIHDFFFMYFLENSQKSELKRKHLFHNNSLFKTKIGEKLLYLIENKNYPVVIKYIRNIINRACKYFEYIFYLYNKKINATNKDLHIYYFNDNYINANSFIYLNGGTNVKFIFFYILKVYFYLKKNPYSSIFDIYKNVEILNFCDLSFLLKAMYEDGFVCFTLMYVSKKSQMYKLKKNYKIINDFNNLILYKKLNRKIKNTYNLFENTTSFEDSTTDYNILNELKKNKVKNLSFNENGFNKSHEFHTNNSFIDKMMFKKIKLYFVEDDSIIFKKYAGTLWN